MQRASTPSLPAMPLAWVLLFAAAVWAIPALLLTTHQWRELHGTEKQMTWLQSLAYQAPSWLLLIPATPIVFAVVRRHPLQVGQPGRLLLHVLASVLFGAAFLLIAVPTRNLVHPRPFQWAMFGNAVYKSVPQFVLMGVLAYWSIALVGSLIETRLRLYAVLSRVDQTAVGTRVDTPPFDPPPSPQRQGTGPGARQGHSGPSPADEPARATAPAIEQFVLTTPAGKTLLRAADISWIEPVAGGARLHTNVGPVTVRHSLTDLESILPSVLVRVHRSYMVNLTRVREVTGPPSRDGHIRLDGGELVPLSRRRRAALEAQLSSE